MPTLTGVLQESKIQSVLISAKNPLTPFSDELGSTITVSSRRLWQGGYQVATQWMGPGKVPRLPKDYKKYVSDISITCRTLRYKPRLMQTIEGSIRFRG